MVIGGSSGSTEAVVAALGGLPRDLPAALFYVRHLPPGGESALVERLQGVLSLDVRWAEDGQRFRERCLYVAPPGRHLLLTDEGMRLSRAPTINGWRPAIDALFRSAAVAFGPRAIGVLVSGALDDGTDGLRAIKLCGGYAICQEPGDALAPEMPGIASRTVAVDRVVPAARIGEALIELVRQEAPAAEPPPTILIREVESMLRRTAPPSPARDGSRILDICPECGGPLFEVPGAGADLLGCLVGHAHTLHSLEKHSNERLENTLWAAVVQFRQQGNLLSEMALREREQGRSLSADRYERRAQDSTAHSELLRELAAGATELRRGETGVEALAPALVS